MRQGLRPQSNRWGGAELARSSDRRFCLQLSRRGNRGFPAFLWRRRFRGRVLSMRRVRGWVGAEPERPRVALGFNLEGLCVVQRRNHRVAEATTAVRGDVGRLFFGEAVRFRRGAFYAPHSRLGWRGTGTTPGCVGLQSGRVVRRPAAQPSRRRSNDSGKR